MALNTLRPMLADEGRSTPNVALLDDLAPLLSIAARTTRHIEALTLANSLYRGVLNGIKIPLFGLDAAGGVFVMNEEGETLLRSNRWVSLVQGILAASPTLLACHALTEALNRLRAGLGTTLLLTEGPKPQQAVLSAVPLGGAPCPAAQNAAAGFVWIVPCHVGAGSARSLGRLFELTPAEVAVLDRLVWGATLNDTAAALHISIHTARTHLKTIFRKTGRRTQSQLLALATRMSMIRMIEPR